VFVVGAQKSLCLLVWSSSDVYLGARIRLYTCANARSLARYLSLRRLLNVIGVGDEQ